MKKTGFIKYIRLFLFLIGCFLLTACASKSGSISYQKIDKDKKVDVRITYDYDDDFVTKQVTENRIAYSGLGVSSADEAKEILGNTSQAYQGVKGIKEHIDYNEKDIQEILEVDYKTINFEEVSQLPGMFFSEEAINKQKIPLKDIQKLLDSYGFKEIKDNKFEEFE